MSYHGACFCGAIQFKLVGEIPPLYQCHCSECRKTTGGAANAAFIVLKQNFQWITGESQIKTFLKSSGFKVNFCPTCSSPVPNVITQLPTMMWIPAGLMDDELPNSIQYHLQVASKANWETINGDTQQYAEFPPDLSVLLPHKN